MLLTSFPTFESSILEQFEDIPNDGTIINDDPPSHVSNDDDETVIPVLQADSLTLKDLLHEMEKRSLQARGFFADDAKLLQVELDKEHQEYMELKAREKIEAKKIEAAQKVTQRRKALTEYALWEEKEEVEKNERIAQWFQLLQQGLCPPNCRIEVNNVSVRTLTRLLWTDVSVVNLDLSNLKLSEESGVYIGRMLKNNRTLLKLELGDNMLGQKALCEISEALCNNSVLKYLSLESNPLTANGSSCASKAFAKMITLNKGLTFLSIWRCNMGVEDGRVISQSMKQNNHLLCFEIGLNQWQCSDIHTIENALVRNREQARMEQEVERRHCDMANEARSLEVSQQKQREQAERDKLWLEEQKRIRSTERHEEMEREKENKKNAMEMEQRKRDEEEEQKKLQAMKQKTSKSKTKGKKKKAR